MPVPISADRLRSLFRPRRIALVGASDKSAFSVCAHANMVKFEALDRIVLVNRRGVETHGMTTVRSLRELDQPVDTAYLMVPRVGTLNALRDAHAAGVRNAVILSSGYGETGEAGRAAEAELVAYAQSLDMLVLGPNMMGYANFVDGVPVTSVPLSCNPAGPVALLSQSGASCSAMVDFAAMIGLDLSYMITLGNEAMVTAGHVLDFLVDDEHTKAIAMFLETIRDPDTFRRAARRAADRGKAVVVLKAGSSELSARTAAAHTGAMVGDDRVIDAVLADLGVIRVDSIEDMLITASAAAHVGPLQRRGIGVVSVSGGACDIIADRAADLGAELPELAPATTSAIEEFFADFGTIQNPLDVTGAVVIDPTIFTKAIAAMSADPGVGVVAVVNSIPWEPDGRPWPQAKIAQHIGSGIASAEPAPAIWVNQVVQPISGYTRELMRSAGVPYVLPGLRAAVVALHKIGQWSDRIRQLLDAPPAARPAPSVPPPALRRGRWSETQARELLVDAGVAVVPSVVVHHAEDAVAAAAKMGHPVAVKVVSPDIVHKSDLGGVRLGVVGDDAVRAAYAAVVAAAEQVPGAGVEGVQVSPMRTPAVELLVGVVRDPQWGLILAVGIGGVFVEVLDDVALSPLPASTEDVRRMLGTLRCSAILKGWRGSHPVDTTVLSSVIARIGHLALALGDELVSLEINPLRADGSVVEALDAVVEWRSE